MGRIGARGDSQGDSKNAENPRGRPATDGIGRRYAGGRADASGAADGRDRAEKEICVKAENRMIERGLQKLRFFNGTKKTKRIPP